MERIVTMIKMTATYSATANGKLATVSFFATDFLNLRISVLSKLSATNHTYAVNVDSAID
jgi:hypothetical protein